MTVRLLIGDCRDVLPTLPANSVHCVVTSPPYWGLRDYGTAKWEGGDAACDHRKVADPVAAVATSTLGGGKKTTGHLQEGFSCACRRCGAVRIDSQLGLEKTPDEYVARMVAVFREVRRVLRDDGTLWLNLGDSYASGETGRVDAGKTNDPTCGANEKWDTQSARRERRIKQATALPSKNLVGIPWRVAFALQADGWYLRSDIIWHKPNPMPESVTDRPTKAHEYLFLLTKSASYFYDADAVAEPSEGRETFSKYHKPRFGVDTNGGNQGNGIGNPVITSTRNRRSVWTIATRPYKGAHFATFPPKLIEPCILAGTSPQACEHCAAPWERVTEREADTRKPYRTEGAGGWANGAGRNDGKGLRKVLREDGRGGDLATIRHTTTGWQPTCDCENNTGSARCVVLDPFGGAGTTGLVADRLGRDAILIELNKEYTELGTDRITDDAPLFANVHVGNGNGNGHA